MISALLIIGFLTVDALFFHDTFKPGEVTTLPQYLTGLLSLPVFVLSLETLLSRQQSTR